MKTKNISGFAYHFFPSDLSNKLDRNKINTATQILEGGAVAFFIGTMPSALTLYTETSFEKVVNDHADNLVFRVDDMSMRFSYNKLKKERIVQKYPVDAVSYVSSNGIEDGTDKIGWAVIKIAPLNPGVEDYLVFTDNIGTWDSPNIVAMFENLTAISGESVLFKDLTISIRDIHELDV